MKRYDAESSAAEGRKFLVSSQSSSQPFALNFWAVAQTRVYMETTDAIESL